MGYGPWDGKRVRHDLATETNQCTVSNLSLNSHISVTAPAPACTPIGHTWAGDTCCADSVSALPTLSVAFGTSQHCWPWVG